MLELHELLGRDIDPIDDIRHRFEDFYTQGYRDPSDGDWFSDDYFRIIDLTTQPAELNEDEAGKLNRSITRLNEKYRYIEMMLGGSSLLGAYNYVAEQVSGINGSNPKRSDIVRMQPVPIEEAV